MRTLTDKYLGGLEIADEVYQADLAVLDRYQSFSGELLRLSLLGIAGYGFIVTNVILKPVPTISVVLVKWILPLGALCFALCAISALGHRYFSTDCLAHYIRRIRLAKRKADSEDQGLQATIDHEENSLEKDLIRCKWLLLISVLSLICGAACVAWAFALIIFAA